MDDILSALINIGSKGSFCAKQTAFGQDLHIKITGYPGKSGALKFPLSARAAKSLIKIATPAKFGWKDQTLLDPKVRNVWEIPKSKVKIDNRRWNKTLNPLLEELKAQLGLPVDSKLKAHLHNLLIYEPGQFFKPHQDSEKLDGMVATLVVVLPSFYRGGTLVVDHQGDKKRFQATRSPDDKLTLIAFYADCHHEVKPVTEGYRVTLTYNLVLENSGKQAFLPTGDTATLASALNNYFNVPEAGKSEHSDASYIETTHNRAKKWVYLLDHQYTQKSLRWGHLKNEDQVRVDLLRAAAQTLNLETHLSLVEIQETWDCEEEYNDWDYGYRGRSYWDRYNDYDDEDEDEEPEQDILIEGGHILQDLIESSISFNCWIDENNKPVNCSGLYISSDEICWTKATDEFDPFESEYEGYMGNYGNTLDRWYHRAAIILWRKEDRYAILCELDPNKVAKEMLQLAKRKGALPETQKCVRGILPFWATNTKFKEIPQLSGNTFKLALQIQSAELARDLLLPLGLKALTPQSAKVLARLEKAYSTPWCLAILQSWSSQKGYGSRYSNSTIGQLSRIVKALVDNAEGKCGLLDWLLGYQFEKLKGNDSYTLEYSTQVEIKAQEDDRVKAIVDMLLASFYANDEKFHKEIMSYVMNNTVLYSKFGLADILQHIPKFVTGADFKKWGYGSLLDHTMGQFELRIKEGERKKGDWSIEMNSPCSCEDCKQLNHFLQSRTTRELTWPLSKDRRRHIHQKIDGMGLPVTHTTRREGSPHKLVLTKTNRLFTQDKAELQEAMDVMAELKKITTTE